MRCWTPPRRWNGWKNCVQRTVSMPSGAAATRTSRCCGHYWRLLNPGSVGLPFQKRGGKYVNLAYAEYLLLDRARQGWNVTFRRVPYDLAALRAGILASGMPHAQWLADEWVEG
ncbi:hypothetical protein [Deinococcus marmoris]|nr:hypothetical protein [Deinococcus marmoris]